MKHQNPTEEANKVRICVVLNDAYAACRLKEYFSRSSLFKLTISAELPPPYKWNIAVIPINTLQNVLTLICKYPLFVYGPAEYIGDAMSIGAVDYLKETWGPEELFYRLERYIQFTSIKSKSALTADLSRLLNHQERVILEYMITKLGKTVSREELQLHLWGKIKPMSRGIDMHISHIRKKLLYMDTTDSTFSIETINGCGYVVNSLKKSQYL